MAKLYMYVVARDFGFAPNPFHGTCTLATCKPRIRSVAQVGDWVVGMGGRELNASGRCIYVMQVSGSMSFEEYWDCPRFRCKRPRRNGSRKVMLGDNIYHRGDASKPWIQEDSHHSRSDGTPEPRNVKTDTSVNRVLYSDRFIYFGSRPMKIPQRILGKLPYTNGRNHRTYANMQSAWFIEWMASRAAGCWNLVLADPHQFSISSARYSGKSNRVILT